MRIESNSKVATTMLPPRIPDTSALPCTSLYRSIPLQQHAQGRHQPSSENASAIVLSKAQCHARSRAWLGGRRSGPGRAG